LGGDSLSRARIVVSVEKAFDFKLPEDVIPSFTTIRKMANWLTKALPDCQKAAAEGLLKQRWRGPADSPHHPGVELPRPDDEEADAELGWAACDNLSEIKLTLDRILLYRTPQDVRAWLATSNSWSTLRSLPWGRAPLRSLRVAVRKRRSIRQVENQFEGLTSIPHWSRSILTENSLLYADPLGTKSEKTLVLGFCGTLMRLMLPVYHHLIHLNPLTHDLLLIRDPARNHFELGSPGLGDSIEAVAESLGHFARQAGYHRTIAFGTSGGGLAAICSGLINGYDKIIAVSPDSPLRHPPLERCLSANVRAQTHVAAVHVFYGTLNVRDREAAEQLAACLPGVELFPETTSNHNLIHELNEQRKLGRFLAKILAV